MSLELNNCQNTHINQKPLILRNNLLCSNPITEGNPTDFRCK